MVDESVIGVARRFLLRLRDSGFAINRAILFGSHARGTARPDSDIDIFLLSSDFDNAPWRQESLAWEIAQSVDWRLEPVLCSLSGYEENDWHPLILLAKQEGIEIRTEGQFLAAPR